MAEFSEMQEFSETPQRVSLGCFMTEQTDSDTSRKLKCFKQSFTPYKIRELALFCANAFEV